MNVNLTEDPDSFKWNLSVNGLFSVKSLYANLMNDHTRFLHKYLCRLKIPLKIKVFLWFLN